MNTELLGQVLDLLLPILATFLTGVFTYLGNKIKNAYETKLKNETAKTRHPITIIKYIKTLRS